MNSNDTSSSSKRMGRRSFITTAATASAALAFARPAKLLGATISPSEVLNVALVGIGSQGRVLLEDTLKIPGVRFVALCDIWDYNRQYGEKYLKKYGYTVKSYRDYEEMLAQEKDIQAVIVATPDFLHAPISIAAMKAGKDVYCEKMMSNTIEGAKSMVRSMNETGRLLQIGHQRRSNPRYLVAKNRLLGEANLLGKITTANGQWNRAVSEDLGWPNKAAIPKATLAKYGYDDMHQFRNWRWFKKFGGGPLSDLGAHQIDIFNWFFGGPPISVTADGGNDYYSKHEWFDNAMVVYKYNTPQGVARAFYQVQTTTSAGGYFEQFMGVEGTLKMSENPKYTAVYREAYARDWEPWIRRNFLKAQAAPVYEASSDAVVDARETAALAAFDIPVILNKPAHQPHLENFFNSIRGKAKLNCPADEAFNSEIAIFKACEAVMTGKKIEITAEDLKI